ncbi:hypothetical protein BGZ83_003281 [Gryganskiella cystojenkinii]|nr:hypothetical protein BGZ83_003281 [Gryganskiella cystojenkinii]
MASTAFRTFFTASARIASLGSARSSAVTSNPLKLAPHSRIFFRSKHVDYTQKYAEKLKQRAHQEGVKTVEELKAKILPATQTAFKKPLSLETPSTSEQQTTTATATSNQQQRQQKIDASSESKSNNLSLDKIMKLELVKDLDAEAIGKIWIQKHLGQEDTISAVVPAETYKKMLKRSKEYPLFLLPLSHGDGVEFYLLQFNFHQIIFTSLLEYKTHGTNARPYLTLTHYPELIEDKGVVLMNGSVTTDPRVLTVDQAQILTFGLQQYYVSDHPEKIELLHDFHKRPEKFSHERLIALTEISG